MSERTRKANYIKKNGVRGIAAWIMLLMFIIKMVYMSYKSGMIGMSFYAYAASIFVAFYILFSVAVVPVLKKMINYQVNRGSYKNAEKVFRVISSFITLLSGVVAVVLFFFSTAVSMALFQTKLCSLLIKLLAVAILFWTGSYCLKGYMEGIGNAVPGIVADVIAHGTGLVVTILFQPAFADYGRTVATLVRQDSYAYAYSVCSGALGLLVGGVLSYIFLIIIRAVFGKELAHRARGDEMKKTDSALDILLNFFSSYVKTAFVDHIGVILAVVLVIAYKGNANGSETEVGMLFTGIVVLLLPAALVTWQISVPFMKQLGAILKQSDFHHAKEKLSFYLKMFSYTVFPYAAAVFALAPVIAKALFDVQGTDFSGVVRIGVFVMLLLCSGLFFRQVLSVMLKGYMRNIYAAVLGISGFVFFEILLHSGMKASLSVAYAYMLACLLYLLLAGFVVLKKVRIYNRLLQCVLLPLIVAVFSAAVVFGIYLMIPENVAAWIVLILAAALIYGLYNLGVAFLGVFAPHEWSEVPGADIPVAMAKLLGKY